MENGKSACFERISGCFNEYLIIRIPLPVLSAFTKIQHKHNKICVFILLHKQKILFFPSICNAEKNLLDTGFRSSENINKTQGMRPEAIK